MAANSLASATRLPVTSPAWQHRTVGVYDLKSSLSSVIEEVMAGRVVTITRHGHPIASIQPVAATSRGERAAALERLRDQRHGRRLGMTAREAIEVAR